MGRTLTLKASDGHEFSAYRADPTGTLKGALVIIQEIFGVNDHIRSVADRFAKDGYLCVAPAMQDRAERNFEVGYTPADIERGRAVRGLVKNEDSLKDLQATITYLQGEKAGRIGVVGYCWGGSLAWLTAVNLDGVSVAVSYYGGEVANTADARAKCPVMFHFGAKDMSIPLDKVEIVKQKQPDHPVHVYPDAGHGFSCDARGSFHPESHELALSRTRDYLTKYVG